MALIRLQLAEATDPKEIVTRIKIAATSLTKSSSRNKTSKRTIIKIIINSIQDKITIQIKNQAMGVVVSGITKTTTFKTNNNHIEVVPVVCTMVMTKKDRKVPMVLLIKVISI